MEIRSRATTTAVDSSRCTTIHGQPYISHAVIIHGLVPRYGRRRGRAFSSAHSRSVHVRSGGGGAVAGTREPKLLRRIAYITRCSLSAATLPRTVAQSARDAEEHAVPLQQNKHRQAECGPVVREIHIAQVQDLERSDCETPGPEWFARAARMLSPNPALEGTT
jgi:hypothetical protein